MWNVNSTFEPLLRFTDGEDGDDSRGVGDQDGEAAGGDGGSQQAAAEGPQQLQGRKKAATSGYVDPSSTLADPVGVEAPRLLTH